MKPNFDTENTVQLERVLKMYTFDIVYYVQFTSW